jgi:hypothetical protein
VSCVVFGQGRNGKNKAVGDVARRQKVDSTLRVLDETMLRELVQIDLTSQGFSLCGWL